MLTIKVDSWDYTFNQKEICEQIFCEFGKVDIALDIQGELERTQGWHNMAKNFDLSGFYISIDGKKIYENKVAR